MTSLFFVSLFLQFLQERQKERHRDAEGEAIGDGLAQFDAAQAPDAVRGKDGMEKYLAFITEISITQILQTVETFKKLGH